MKEARRRKQQVSPRVDRPKKPSFEALLEDRLRDPAFRQAWETLEPKRRVVAALLRLRAEANLSQKELAERADWSPAFVSRLESFPREGERLYMPDLTTLQTYARACGCELGLVFGRPKGRGTRMTVAATAAFGDDKRVRRVLAALAGCAIAAPHGGALQIDAREKVDTPAAGRTRRQI
jgi:transcriptional regulator with XRE-family HTH domain